MFWAVTTFLLFHAPDGSIIEINPNEVVTMRPKRQGENFPPEAKCHINMADGHFVVTRETCEEVAKEIGKSLK